MKVFSFYSTSELQTSASYLSNEEFTKLSFMYAVKVVSNKNCYYKIKIDCSNRDFYEYHDSETIVRKRIADILTAFGVDAKVAEEYANNFVIAEEETRCC